MKKNKELSHILYEQLIKNYINDTDSTIVPIRRKSLGISVLEIMFKKAKQDILLYLNEIDSDLAFSLTEAAKRGCKVSVATMNDTLIKQFLYNYGVNVYSLKEELYANTFCVVDSCRYTLYREDVKDGIFCAYDLEICDCLNTIFKQRS